MAVVELEGPTRGPTVVVLVVLPVVGAVGMAMHALCLVVWATAFSSGSAGRL